MNINLTKDQVTLLVILTDDATTHGRPELRPEFDFIKRMLLAAPMNQMANDKTAAIKE